MTKVKCEKHNQVFFSTAPELFTDKLPCCINPGKIIDAVSDEWAEWVKEGAEMGVTLTPAQKHFLLRAMLAAGIVAVKTITGVAEENREEKGAA